MFSTTLASVSIVGANFTEIDDSNFCKGTKIQCNFFAVFIRDSFCSVSKYCTFKFKMFTINFYQHLSYAIRLTKSANTAAIENKMSKI